MRTLTPRIRRYALAWLVVMLSLSAAAAQTTTFTYQAKLTDDYNQPTGLYDLQFNLYDEAAGPNAPLNATPVVIEDVQVTNGTFSVALDFGNLFNGGDRYVETGVRPGDDTGAFAVLSQRQRITSAPYSIRSLSAATADTATNAESLGGTAPGSFVQTTDARLTDARTPTAGSSNYIQNASGLQSGANFNISGTGTAGTFNAITQFNIGGNRVLSVTGEDNLFVGGNSGSSNTDGNNNSFVGYHSGSQNTTGYRNASFGAYAGFSNTTGHNNLFLGGAAGATNTTGSFNVFLGESTFVNNSGGNLAGASSYNTFVGALSQITPGNPLFFASAFGAHSRVTTSDTIVLGKIAGVYDGVSRPADTVQIPGHLQVTGSITASSFNGSGLTNINASNITSGTLDNARLGVVPVGKGGTGITSAGASGNFLRSNGTSFTSSPLQLGDVPDLSASYIRNQTAAAQSGGFNVSGNGTAGVFNATTQFNIGGSRVLSVTGTRNIFAGNGAGAANTTGLDNSFFGYEAGSVNTTGQRNSFFGVQAGKSNTTGSNNSFFGLFAGKSNTNGNDNAFFGDQAGQNNTSGGNNSFFGIHAGSGNTSGHSNLFVGMHAGQGNTTGFNNSFVGYVAGSNNTTGNFNSIIGSNAQVGTGNLSYATAIGARAIVNSGDTIVLGKAAGTYDGVSRPADTVRVPGNLSVTGTISGDISGLNLTNLDADNITSGTLADARLSANVATLSGAQTFTGAKTFGGGVSGDGSGLTGLSASNINAGTLDNARLGVVGVAHGGTGLASAGAEGSFLQSSGGGFTSAPLQAADVPDLSASYLQNTAAQQANANFNISGNGVVGGNLSVGGTLNASGAGLTDLNASNIATGTLDSARLGLISTTNIADGAVSTPKIADSAVTAAKIGSNQVVKNINGLTDGVNLAAGANVTITSSGNTLTISAAGGNFIQNTTTQQSGSNFNISGDGTAANLTASSTLSGNVVNAATQFNLGGSRVLSTAGTDNVFVGNSAGTGNVSGHSNSYFGASAGQSNTTGYRNAFFGYFAGLHNTSGSQNVFLGANAGVVNTTGGANSFVGYGAGYGNTFGNANTFFGTFAGYNNTTGVNNTFVGVNAGLNNTTGYFNLFDGLEAGKSNTEGYFNSFVGPNSGYGNTTGYYNSFFGFQAGYTNTTGNNNTIIGTYADVSSNNLSFATAIGAYATVSTSNTIALGRSDGSDKVRIYGLGAAGSAHLCRNANNEVSTCSSSLRYKTNVAPFSPGLGLLQRLRPIRFNWKDGGMKDMGFGAEDVAAVEPLLVTYDDKGRVEGVKYDRISAVLVNAVKEQQTQIETQQAQLNQQQAQIETQQRELRQQQALIDGLKKLLCQQNPTADVCR